MILSNHPHIPWWLTPPWEEPEQEAEAMNTGELRKAVFDLISELENALDNIENYDVESGVEELEAQSGTIGTIIKEYRNE